jgi:hypothetical protein
LDGRPEKRLVKTMNCGLFLCTVDRIKILADDGAVTVREGDSLRVEFIVHY